MHSFTPRTCLWPLTGALLSTFVLSIGLTFRSNHACYAGVCGEWLFPLQARLHVVVWYCWLAISVTILGLRAFQQSINKTLRTPLTKRKIPCLDKELRLSGALIMLWIITLYGAVTAIWWRRLDVYFQTRGLAQGSVHGNRLLAAIALTGHYGDITMGMALLPVSRHSALASFFKISVSTTLTFHMLTAYTLFTIILVHGFLYIAWLTTRTTLSLNVPQSYPLLEPTYEMNEVFPGNTSSLGIWRASLIFTGTVSALIILVILVTALPKLRKLHFNLFYFTHLTSILAVVVVCLHASTMFYCTAPGLAMIVLDWGMRMYELRQVLSAQVSHLGRGWYVLSVGLPRERLRGCSCKSPLAHFYIRHSASSLRELHPFTTITHLATQGNAATPQDTSLPIQFLFRKSRKASRSNSAGSLLSMEENNKQLHPIQRLIKSISCTLRRKNNTMTGLQWTEKVAALADLQPNTVGEVQKPGRLSMNSGSNAADTKIRFEGPYFTPALPQQYDSVVCIVAGTGISGALAIAAAFAARWDTAPDFKSLDSIQGASAAEQHQSDTNNSISVPPSDAVSPSGWQRLSIWWTVRAEDYIELPFESLRDRPGFEMHPFLTSPGRPRMDIPGMLRAFQSERTGTHETQSTKTKQKVWAYISGPNGFITAAESACKQTGVDYYGARWDI